MDLDRSTRADVTLDGATVAASADRPARPARDPARMLAAVKAQAAAMPAVWVFGYASLIWRPEFDAAEHLAATVHGYHRTLSMRSRTNRGTPECPGLVFGLVSGGSCRGMAYRIDGSRLATELDRLWEREMHNAVYDPKWLDCRTANGIVPALAFTLSRCSPNFTGDLGDDEVLDILRRARGRFGTTLDYLRDTDRGLRSCGIVDREVHRLCILASKAGL